MSFTESILNAGDFGPGDTEWIHLIIGEWQIIADVAHSDLVLWFPTDYVVADGSVPDSVSGPSITSNFLCYRAREAFKRAYAFPSRPDWHDDGRDDASSSVALLD